MSTVNTDIHSFLMVNINDSLVKFQVSGVTGKLGGKKHRLKLLPYASHDGKLFVSSSYLLPPVHQFFSIKAIIRDDACLSGIFV